MVATWHRDVWVVTVPSPYARVSLHGQVVERWMIPTKDCWENVLQWFPDAYQLGKR